MRSPGIKPARKGPGAAAPLRLELVDLETFAVVAMLGSFSAAARPLNITQPSVTSRIRRLESSLGTKLLIRTTRKVELTRRGSLLRAEADKTLAGLRRIADRFRLDAAAARNRVVVAATPMVAATMRHGDALQAMRAAMPMLPSSPSMARTSASGPRPCATRTWC